jgi:hypothetical protein
VNRAILRIDFTTPAELSEWLRRAGAHVAGDACRVMSGQLLALDLSGLPVRGLLRVERAPEPIPTNPSERDGGVAVTPQSTPG